MRVSKTQTRACLTRRRVLCAYFGPNIFDLYCICSRKCPVGFLIFHPFVSFLFLRTDSSWEKKHTRIVCQPTRQVAETMIRSISCSLQLRLKSNENKKFGDKMLTWNGHWEIVIFFSSERDFHSRNAAFNQVLIYQDCHTQILNTINFIYYLISKNLSSIT